MLTYRQVRYATDRRLFLWLRDARDFRYPEDERLIRAELERRGID